jgi:hypothetical protein
MKTIAKFGLAALAVGAFSTLPSKADTPDATFAFTKHGLPVPGAYFTAKERQQATTLAVSKSGQGVGEGKQTVSEVVRKHPHHVRSTTKDIDGTAGHQTTTRNRVATYLEQQERTVDPVDQDSDPGYEWFY